MQSWVLKFIFTRLSILYVHILKLSLRLSLGFEICSDFVSPSTIFSKWFVHMYVKVFMNLSLIYFHTHCWNHTICCVSVGLLNALATALPAQVDSKNGLALMHLWAAKWLACMLVWCGFVFILKTWVSCYLLSSLPLRWKNAYMLINSLAEF